ncbi:glycosyltransferase [Gallaecimonas mangrovi]|uniref:glycosyltransferase n=1 Tax=Gallaecimonas mangrovi TaxID=2291597 RepID=UPI001D01FA23|nr:glycosyltransferase [Gallaecimonas mangrovi]
MTAANSAICFVNTNAQWGGGEKWHLATACYFREQGVPTLMVTNSGSALFAASSEQGFSPFTLSVGNLSLLNPFKLQKLVAFFKQNQVSTVVLNLPSDAKFAGVAAKLAGVKQIVYRRGMPKKPSSSIVNKWLFNKVLTHIVGNSEEIINKMVKGNESWFPTNKTCIIYNGVDPNLPPANQRLFAKQGDEIIIGNVGRLVDQKGQHWLVDICKRLKESGRQVRFVIAGEGEKRAELEALIKDNGLANDISLLGHVSDMAGFMNSIDMLAFTSKYEGSANTLIEALYFGVPVVAFNASSNPEVVIDEQTGLLAEAFSVEQMAAQLARLIDDKALRQRLIDGGKALVQSKFDMYQNLEKLMAIHQQR